METEPCSVRDLDGGKRVGHNRYLAGAAHYWDCRGRRSEPGDQVPRGTAPRRAVPGDGPPPTSAASNRLLYGIVFDDTPCHSYYDDIVCHGLGRAILRPWIVKEFSWSTAVCRCW